MSISIKQLSLSAVSLLLVATIGCHGAEEWDHAQLTSETAADDACLDELQSAMTTILRHEDLTGVEIAESDVETLAQTGTAEQFVNLYGGDQIRHWAIATFDEGGCYIYNHATAAIDIASGEQDLRERTIRGQRNEAARLELQRCDCQTAQ